MNAIKIFSALGFIWMAAGITYGFVVGDFFGEAKVLLPYPWFQMSMLDLYSGLSLFSCWIIFRERSLAVAIAWIVALILLGNLVTFAYAFIVAHQSKRDWRLFWLGKDRVTCM
ncbi:hypothetical protein BH10PLA1_BH10PLA1_01840 [soil metagenome]